jgi:putative transposase
MVDYWQAEELERRRRLAVTRVLEGYPVREVAAFLGVTERSINRWLEACRRSGDLDALKAQPSPGRPRKLTGRQGRTGLGWLTKSPTAFGFAGEMWTSRRLATLIERRWGVRFNPNYLVEWLSARRHSAQKPTSRAKERDSGGRGALAGRRLAAHSKKAHAEGAHLVLIDESGFFLNPLVRRIWARKGKTPVLRTFGRRRRKVSVVAALSVAPGRRIGLYVHADAQHAIGAPTIVAFLREVLGHLRGRVIVLWDGGTNHKGPLIRELLARYPRLGLEPLPTYAPQLNPVEFVWSYLKYGQLANFVPKHLRQLDQTVQAHLSDVRHRPSLLKSLWIVSELTFPNTVIS